MHSSLLNIWNEAKKLPRSEKFILMEKLVRHLKSGNENKEKEVSWKDLYGIGKGVWPIDAQEYVNQVREDRF